MESSRYTYTYLYTGRMYVSCMRIAILSILFVSLYLYFIFIHTRETRVVYRQYVYALCVYLSNSNTVW